MSMIGIQPAECVTAAVAEVVAQAAGSTTGLLAAEISSYVSAWVGSATVMSADEAQQLRKKFSMSSSSATPLNEHDNAGLDPLALLVAAAAHSLPLPPDQVEQLWAAAYPSQQADAGDRAAALVWALSKLHVVSEAGHTYFPWNLCMLHAR